MYYAELQNLETTETQTQLEGRLIERIPPPPTWTFQNLITSSPVAKGMTGEVW